MLSVYRSRQAAKNYAFANRGALLRHSHAGHHERGAPPRAERYRAGENGARHQYMSGDANGATAALAHARRHDRAKGEEGRKGSRALIIQTNCGKLVRFTAQAGHTLFHSYILLSLSLFFYGRHRQPAAI